MAGVTPRKRKRGLDGMHFIHGNPVKKLVMDFTEEVSVERGCASPVNQMSALQDEDKENQSSPQRSTKAQNPDGSPLQTASVPKGTQRQASTRMSPEAGATYTSIVSTTSFYCKEKPFLNILERSLANGELRRRNEEGNLPVANKTEAVQVKMKTVGNRCPKGSKRPASFKQSSFLPKRTKKAKLEIVPPKCVERKENVNCSVEKKMEAPFRVLSMKTKPALKLQIGAAFFATGKKAHCGAKKDILSPSSAHSSNSLAVQEKQGKNPAHKRRVLSTEIKTAGSGREGSRASGPKKQDAQNITQGSSRNVDKKDYASSSEVTSEIIKDQNKSCSGSNLADKIHPLFSTPSDKKQRPQSFPGEQPSLMEVSPVVPKFPPKLKAIKKTRNLSNSLRDQMVIDAGQKHFGAIVCKSCGMVYSSASPEDEAHHVQYHQRFLDGIKYVSWKNERVVAQFWDGKIVMIQQGDSKYATKKADDVRELIDRELGFKQVALTYPTQTQTYLFVYNEKKIIGCLIAEPVKQAFRVLSEPTKTLASPSKASLDPQRAWRCSTKPEKVFCGISRIWVFSLMRRKRVASRMVDVVRRTFLFGSYLGTDEIAFSDPTPDGKLFASKYCQTPNFLVYNFVS